MNNPRPTKVDNIPSYVESYEDRVRLCEFSRIEEVVEKGDDVVVESRNGTYTLAEFHSVEPDLIGEYEARFSDEHDTLANFWLEDEEVGERDRVILVFIGEDEYAYPATKVELPSITEVSGVGSTNAKILKNGGYRNWVDLMQADQSDLSSVDSVGNALAARIKAEVGSIGDVSERREPSLSGSCPVRTCGADVSEETLYDHMISTHGWYMESLEVDDGV